MPSVSWSGRLDVLVLSLLLLSFYSESLGRLCRTFTANVSCINLPAFRICGEEAVSEVPYEMPPCAMAGHSCSECGRKSWREAWVGVISTEVAAEALGAPEVPQGSAGVTRTGKEERSMGRGRACRVRPEIFQRCSHSDASRLTMYSKSLSDVGICTPLPHVGIRIHTFR